MAYTTAVNRNTGDLITSGIWNQDAVDNPNFLKGLAGPVDIADDLNPTTDAFSGTPLDLGLGGAAATAKRWQDVQAVRLFGNRYQADLQRRTVVLTWENLDIGAGDAFSDHQMVKTVTNNGDAVEAGLGQILLLTTTAIADNCHLTMRRETIAPIGVALDNRFAGSRLPYIRFEFSTTTVDVQHRFFLGLRATPSGATPVSGEDHMGFRLDPGAVFEATVGDGGGLNQVTFTPVGINLRTIVEMAILSGSLADFYVDGAFGGQFTTNIPTGLMELSLMVDNFLAPAVDQNVTVGMSVVQEDRA